MHHHTFPGRNSRLFNEVCSSFWALRT